ncbi:MAG: hypothetical protein K8W52_44070 [Deltaproteobacteria bacterium]|nr:hypothetical protein [Deltaproteobacteria bacterium]
MTAIVWFPLREDAFTMARDARYGGCSARMLRNGNGDAMALAVKSGIPSRFMSASMLSVLVEFPSFVENKRHGA